jgi:DNA-binding NtrC family response regulator
MSRDKQNQKRVLVVEDEPVISRICQRILVSAGFEVDIAINGEVAKNMVDEKKYDLCLSDIRTPRMNGIELFEYLEQNHPELARNVIFTTGDVLSNNIETFLKRVKRPFLAKPFTSDELEKVIEKALGQESAQNHPDETAEYLYVKR